jgi:hypothetical protein
VFEKDTDRKTYMGFWLASLCLSYLHYAGLVLFLSFGLIFLLLFLNKKNRPSIKSGFILFGPPALLYLPWLPGMYHHLTSSAAEGWQKTPDLVTLDKTFTFLAGPDELRTWLYGTAVGLSVLVLSAKWLGGKMFPDFPRHFFILALALSFLPIAVFFGKSSFSQSAYNHRHFIHAIPLMALLSGYFLAAPLKKIPQHFQRPALLILILLILLGQIQLNNDRALYTALHFKEEYREASQVVVQDKLFIQQKNPLIISSNRFFDHYLAYYSNRQIQTSILFKLKKDLQRTRQQIDEIKPGRFYYLERIRRGPNAWSPSRQLARFYPALCRTTFVRTQAVQYAGNQSVSSPVMDWDSLPPCNK